MPKARTQPYEWPLTDDLAAEILNIPAPPTNGIHEVVTIGDRLHLAMAAVEEANAFLATSPLAKIVARSIMSDLKRRGEPSIKVRPDGKVMLHIDYEGHKSKKPQAIVQAPRKSDLPYLDDLRAEAEALGIDISDLGRQRRAIHERVQMAKTAAG